MKARKTHLKSRTGCATCRGRRIKCDEAKPQCMNCIRRQVRCDFLGQALSSQSFSGESSTQVARILRANSDSAHGDADDPFEEPQSLRLLFPIDESPDLSKQERFLMAHLCKISDDLVAVSMDALDFGLSLLPESNRTHRISVGCSFVRHSVCGLASTHLALLTQSSSMVYLAYYYRDLALRGLRESLTVLNRNNVDAMLAASCLLSWQAPESQEFMQTMKGVDLALNEMEKFGHQSQLRSLIQQAENRETVLPENALHSVDASVELACSTLKELQKQVGDDAELVRGIKELINFLQNLRISPPGPTPDEQLQALHPIRHWLSWLPKALLRLSDRDPLLMVFLAHYNMVVLAVESILPATRNPFAISKRVEFIERLDKLISEVRQTPAEESPKSPSTRRRRESLSTLMFGLMAFARQWRQTNPTNLRPSDCTP
ncbi:hypothetical protein D6C98_08819 [Aureobasidium pullulans]|uniref:Zn(2)-C6 fungal-type domain-containing protein n=1 Tax=Aureobasidium pullulans TaxID=5580 RepID=A0A4V4K006_AURPU|nr:hypothetical protein D6C98_08819 [Aureobasidium pullulans]THZ68919.1 hypothetical protein D6C85_07137 [Aureobasidium pullulans]